MLIEIELLILVLINSAAFLKLFTFQSYLSFAREKKFNVLEKSSMYIIETRNHTDHAVMILSHVPQIAKIFRMLKKYDSIENDSEND